MSSLLDQLKTMTNIVADTGDVDAIRRAQPEEAGESPAGADTRWREGGEAHRGGLWESARWAGTLDVAASGRETRRVERR